MRDLLSQALRFVELRPYTSTEVPEALSALVHTCDSAPIKEYYAVDSGYAVLGYKNIEILVQSIVAVGPSIRRRVVIRPLPDRADLAARMEELRMAEELPGLVLVDGPLTPYVVASKCIGVSKDPRRRRYGPRIPDPEARDAFIGLSRRVGELSAAEVVLSRSPRGSYLVPVDLGNYFGTFFKSDMVVYVEFPKSYRAELLCGLFKRYPMKLRIAHRLASINDKYIKTIGIILSRIDRTFLPKNREFI